MNHFEDGYPARGTPRQKPVYGEKHRYVLRAIRGLQGAGRLPTDEQIYDLITARQGKVISPSGCRTRRAELVELGLVEKGTAQGRSESGRPCSTWRLTEKGAALAQREYEAAQQMSIDFGRAA